VLLTVWLACRQGTMAGEWWDALLLQHTRQCDIGYLLSMSVRSPGGRWRNT
jgi:hypothetical protein